MIEREPAPPPPILITEPRQLHKLGELKDRPWYRIGGQVTDEFELLASRPIPDRGAARLSDGAVYVEGTREGERVRLPTKRWPAGTFANGGKVPAPAPAKLAKPSRAVDELMRYWPRKPASMTSVGLLVRDVDAALDAAAFQPYAEAGKAPREPAITNLFKPAVEAPRGPEQILERLAKRGIEIKPSADGEMYVVAPAGALDHASRDAIEAARPLLRPFVHGTPARCALPHDGEPPPAVTVLLGGALACAEHVA
jgi:hypothetical protein